MRELPFVQVRATSRQVLVGPYGMSGGEEGGKVGQRRLKPASGAAVVVELMSFGSSQVATGSRDSPCDVRPQSQLLRAIQ